MSSIRSPFAAAAVQPGDVQARGLRNRILVLTAGAISVLALVIAAAAIWDWQLTPTATVKVNGSVATWTDMPLPAGAAAFLAVSLLGCVGAFLSGVRSVSRTASTCNPFNLSWWQSWLKLPVGALSAIVGIFALQAARFPRFPRQAGWNYSRGPSRSARRSKQSHGSSACGYKVPSETRTESDDMTAAGMAAVCAGEPAPSPSRPQAFQAARCIGLGMTAHRPDARHPLADMATPSRPVRWSSCGAPQPVTTAGRPSGPRAGGRQTDAWRSSLTPTAGTIHVCPDTRSAADACIRFSADEA